jgi:glycosyltransferase involved in cell wall biosynthesis
MSDQPRNSAKMPRLVYATTHPIALRYLLTGQLAYFQQHGYEVFAVASPGEDLEVVAQREGVRVVPLPMAREISPLHDLRSLYSFVRLLRKLRPDVVVAGTAKAGLLGMLAAWVTRVPARVYILHGLRLETTQGFKRRILSWAERITSACSQRVICISHSLAEVYRQLGLTSPDKQRVLGRGSSNGIRAERFLSTPERQKQAAEIREKWKIPADAPVVGFVGRLVRDKGVVDVIDAFDILLEQFPNARLLMLGEFESGDPIPQEYVRRIQSDPRIIYPGFVDEPAPYYAAIDVLAFPTYREGFGNVVIEAGAAGKPSVVYAATGAIDTVRDGITGKAVQLGDRQALAAAIADYFHDPALRAQHGASAVDFAVNEFRPEQIWAELELEIRQLLDQQASPRNAR